MGKKIWKVLFVDDPEIAAITRVKKALERLGCKVEMACSGNEAIEKLETSCYDAVLLEIWLSHGPGEKIPKEVKGSEAGMHILQRLTGGEFEEKGTKRDVPVVVLTACSDVNTIRKIKEMLGREGRYLYKPRDPNRVAKIVKAAIEMPR